MSEELKACETCRFYVRPGLCRRYPPQATMQLRWYYKYRFGNPALQQLWIASTGERDWRDIPVAHKP